MRPPYSRNCPCSRCRRRKAVPRALRCDGSALVDLLFVLGLLVGLQGFVLQQVHAAADGFLRHGPHVERGLEEVLLHLGVEGHGGGRAEQLAVDPEVDGRLVVRRRHEDAARRIDAEPEHGRRVQIGEEDQRVERRVVALQVFGQRRRPGALFLEPAHLVFARVLVVEDPVRELVEVLDVPGPGVGESADRHPADAVGALRIFVLPGDVIARAGGQHLHLVLRRHPFGDQPAVVFGAAEDLGAVALNDECNLHDGFSGALPAPAVASRRSSSRMMRSSPKSRRRRRWPAMTRERSWSL